MNRFYTSHISFGPYIAIFIAVAEALGVAM
jgi:hypothetical protein